MTSSISPWVRREGMALLVDFYELTMLAGYQATGRCERRACFDYSFRELPVDSGFATSAGLEQVLAYLEELHFAPTDLEYLAGQKIFGQEFLDYLAGFSFGSSVWAVPEGSVVFGGEPLLRVEGPLGEVQFIETFVLNGLNYPTLVASKAARVRLAAGGDPVMEFGLRRAPGPDGGLSGSRAAYIGGVDSTSNVLAGQAYGIPVAGTQAHSWVMSFDSELESFRAYARVFGEKPILLVDTYDTAGSGLPNALKVFGELRERGKAFRPAVRLDSGDLLILSKLAHRMFVEAGFDEPLIVGSGDLDELRIAELKRAGAKINCWGVGTQLITSYNFPALGGVYKLSAVEKSGQWEPKLKVSGSFEKLTRPGRQQVWRSYGEAGLAVADVVALADEDGPEGSALTVVEAGRSGRRVSLRGLARWEQLLEAVMIDGRRVGERESLAAIRDRAAAAVRSLPAQVKLLQKPGEYPVYFSEKLARLSQELIKANKEIRPG